MKWLDLPPLWLGLAVLAMWAEVRQTGGVDLPPWAGALGWGMIGFGVLFAAIALGSFTKANTSPIPHTQPTAIITGGLYRFTRNPIYLADAIMLLGAGLVMGAVTCLVLLPAFVFLIERRFIRAEEARLAAAFPEEWAEYSANVRRWI